MGKSDVGGVFFKIQNLFYVTGNDIIFSHVQSSRFLFKGH